jgi:Zn-dependent protease with chaperone function
MDTKFNFFQKMFELNDDYHNKKEQMIWLATTVYLGFVVVSAKWFSENALLWKSYWLWVVGFVIVVFLFASWFIWEQIKLKARSADLTGKMQAFLPRFDDSDRLSFSEIRSVCRLPAKACWGSLGPTKICIPVVFVFLLAQLAVILLVKNP